MAKALANESSRNFISVKGPELFSKFVGESEKAIKEIFRKARAAAPSIIFFVRTHAERTARAAHRTRRCCMHPCLLFLTVWSACCRVCSQDEIDSIAAKRSEGGGEGGERVAHRVLSQLLSEFDGIEPLRQVTILAATNRPDLIDAALLRPGRIDRILYVSPPDRASCEAILRIEFRRIGAAAAGVDVPTVAAACDGMSGAELSALCREAALVAMEADVRAHQLTTGDFLQARGRIQPRITPTMIQFYDEYRAKATVASV